MEYSLYHLNKQANLKNLKINEIVDKLNLIGFEVDDIFDESLQTNKFIKNTRLLIEIPSNRQDLLNEKLFLQEISTIFSADIYNLWTTLRPSYKFLLEKQKAQQNKCINKIIDSTLNDILIYKFKIKNYFNKKTPLWIKQKLIDRGVIVSDDINDFINLIFVEYGSTIISSLGYSVNDNFSISRLEENEKFQNIEIPLGSIVLKNKQKEIISVIGYIKGQDSEKYTNGNLDVEILFYDIYKNHLHLKTIDTKLSFKYLRTIFIENFQLSIKRFLTILNLYNPGLTILEIHSNQNNLFDIKQNKIICLNKKLVKQILNIKTFDKEIFKKASLRIIGETKTKFYISVPNFRKDLTREIDLIEEYSRFIGYKNFPEIIPSKNLIYTKKKLNNYDYIKTFFISYGFNEVFTNSLISENEKISQFSIKLKNPLNKEINSLRTSLFPRLFEVMNLNLKAGFINCNFFEIGRVFKISNNKIIEQDKIAGIFQYKFTNATLQKNIEWFILKGFFELFLSAFNYKNLETDEIKNKTNYFHPTRSINFKIGNKILGTFGEINPILEEFQNTKNKIYLFEFNLIYLKNWQMKRNIHPYKEYSKYPSIIRDLSFTINKFTDFSSIKNFIQNNTKYLKSIKFFDVYFNNKENNKINLGLRLEFQTNTQTLTSDEIDANISKLIESLIKVFDIQISP